MNRLGMMVDISHVSDRTFYRTLNISRAPVIASHSDRRSALCDAPRNMTDDMLRAVAHYGGPKLQGRRRSGQLLLRIPVAGLSRRCKSPGAGDEQGHTGAQGSRPKRKASRFPTTRSKSSSASIGDRIPRPPLSVLIDHIDHIAKVAGVDHVGIGSDFDGISGQLPEGIDSAADLPKITEALMARGYSAEDCRKILGGNLLRVFREVEQVAKELQAENRPRIS
jgi:membrane dipeptidase